MSNIHTFINLGKELEDITNEASSLWSWLPSYKVAEKHHGDYKYEVQPKVADVITEASMYFAKLKHRPNEPLNDEEKEWFERCPCGESHDD